MQYTQQLLFLHCSFSFAFVAFGFIFSFVSYAKDQRGRRQPFREETMMSFCAFVQCVLLASFAAILFAHRSEILDKAASTLGNETLDDEAEAEQQQQQRGYRAPRPI